MPPRFSRLKTILCALAFIAMLISILYAEVLSVSIPAFIIFLILAFIAKVVK